MQQISTPCSLSQLALTPVSTRLKRTMDNPTTGAAMYKTQLPPDPSMLYGETQPMGSAQGGGMPAAMQQQGQAQPQASGHGLVQHAQVQPPQGQHPSQAQSQAQAHPQSQPQAHPQSQAQSQPQHQPTHPQSQEQAHPQSQQHQPQSQPQSQSQPKTQSAGATSSSGWGSWVPSEAMFKPLCDSLEHIVDSSDPGRFAAAQPDQLARACLIVTTIAELQPLRSGRMPCTATRTKPRDG